MTKPPGGERRRDPTLRELLDELIEHVRAVSRQAGQMEPKDVAHAQERLEWLADEIWRQVSEKKSNE